MSTKFLFHVLPRTKRIPSDSKACAYLVEDGWNDWFKYQTAYSLTVFDAGGHRHDIGLVKIGCSKMPKDSKRPGLPGTFTRLDKEFFSLGQSEEYYEQLGKFDEALRQTVLLGLRDVVASPTRWNHARKHDVTVSSLLRSVSSKSVTGQFRRLLDGGLRQTRFSFRFDSPEPSEDVWAVPPLSFEVEPDSLPPSNVHALIGRNGVGKSRLLYVMAKAMTEGRRSGHGEFISLSDDDEAEPLFANVVSVSFSAFDAFPPLDEPTERPRSVKYFYIGLSRSGQRVPRPHAPKTPGMLAKEFADSVAACLGQKRGFRWLRALELLETDPLFKDAEIASLATASAGSSNKGLAESVFQRLSSGHKIVLLTITRLVQVIEEKTLVLIDEPEAHLHPPLLSAFIRALSDLLIDRNAVSLIATHSPVVLQEVPKSCVWVLRRSGREVVAERPESETFGEGVGVLTHEVFRLEASQSGFHQLLMAAAREHESYEDALDAFDGSLGAEARAVLQALIVSSGD